MSGNDGDEYVLKLRADVSGAKSDLRAINADIEALRTNFQKAFNAQVASPTAQAKTPQEALERASNDFKPADLRQASPQAATMLTEMQRLQRQAERLTVRAGLPSAAAGGGVGAGTPGKPAEITANDSFFDRLARSNVKAGLNQLVMRAAGGRVDSVSSVLGLVKGALGEMGPLGLAAGAAGGAALAISDRQATVQSQMTLLASSLTGGPSMGNPLGLASDIRNQGQAFNYGPDQAMKIASDLALAGVGRANLVGSVGATAMLARRSGVDPGQVTPLTSALSVQGGMGHEQLSAAYQDLSNLSDAAGGSGPSLLRLIDSLKTLEQQTGGAAISLSGLAAVSKILGPSYNPGAALAGAIGSSGTNQLQQAAVLGMSPDAYARVQKDPARLSDAIGGFVRQIAPKGGVAQDDIAITTLRTLGLVNFDGMNPAQQRALVDRQRQGGAVAEAARLAAQATRRRVSEQAALGGAARTTAGQTGLRERVGIALDNRITQTFNPDPQSDPGGYRRRYATQIAQTYDMPTDLLTKQANAQNTPPTADAMYALAAHDRLLHGKGDSWAGVMGGGGFTGGDSGWGANAGGGANVAPINLRITVVTQDQSGRTTGNTRVTTKIDPHRRLTGARTWGPS